jgi:hypothetical protein
MSPNPFLVKINTYITCTVEKSSPKVCAKYVIKNAQSIPPPNRQKGAQSSHLCENDFDQFDLIKVASDKCRTGVVLMNQFRPKFTNKS